ncbi:MAG TPA: hypothetical protein VIY86_12795 [Pirellulaceae bacterium]
MNHLSTEFDPYLKWLGIRHPERPPNHYRLLGLELFEADLDVIATAADRQMSHVRRFHHGQRVELTQQLLNELASAKVCLLRTESKAAYDEQLRIQEISQSMAPFAGEVHPRGRLRRNRRLTAAVALAALVCAGVVWMNWNNNRTQTSDANHHPEVTRIENLEPREPEEATRAGDASRLPTETPITASAPEELAEPRQEDPPTTEEPTAAADIQSVPLDSEQDSAVPDDDGGSHSEVDSSVEDAEIANGTDGSTEATDTQGGFAGLSPQAKRQNMRRLRVLGSERTRDPDAEFRRRGVESPVAAVVPGPALLPPADRDAQSDESLAERPRERIETDDSVSLTALDGTPVSVPSATFVRLRDAMKQRDVPRAWTALKELESEAGTYEQRDAADRLRMLLYQWERFWQAFDQGVAMLQPGTVITYQGQELKVSSVAEGKVTWETPQGPKEASVRRDDVDTRLAIMLVSAELSRRGAAAEPPIAAFLAVDPKGDPAQAAVIWQSMRNQGLHAPFPAPETPRSKQP